jgi:class 3 adenylate cyclase
LRQRQRLDLRRRRGINKTADVERVRLTVVRDAEVRYVEHEGNYLAYTVFGEGPIDLAVAPNQVPIDLIWVYPQLAAFMEALGRMARVIAWDSRGFGGSDPIYSSAAATAEVFADDIRAVLDAADADQVTLFEMDAAGQSLVFAATYPERTRSVIGVNLRPGYSEFRGFSAEQRKQVAMAMRSPEWLRVANPRVAHDPVVQQWWGRAARLANSPEEMALNLEHAQHSDYRAVFSIVHVPTLVLHRRDNRVWDIETSRTTASRIPGARFVELPGGENSIFLGDTAPVLDEIERFLREPQAAATSDRVLATVLFTDIVASTEQLAASGDDAWGRALDEHDRTMERLVASYRGRVVKSTGDGILATFDGPARAVRCAAEMIDAASQQGITLRAGLHTGEIEFRPNDLLGIAVHTAERISALAEPSEIVVSRTVVDLTAGSGLQFEARGERELKGVPGTWLIFGVLPSA